MGLAGQNVCAGDYLCWLCSAGFLYFDQEELSPLDKQYLSFGKLFEQHFLNQGFDANRSIEETLDLGWDLVSVLPREALDRLDNALLDQYYNHEKAIERTKERRPDLLEKRSK